MSEIIYNIINSPLGPIELPINPIWEWVVLGIVELIAFKIAWEVSPGGFLGSEIHWFVRILFIVVVWAILYGVIALIRFLVSHWLIVLGIAILIIGIIAVAHYYFNKKDCLNG